MTVQLANLYNLSKTIVKVQTYTSKGVAELDFDTFDDAVVNLIQRGFSLKTSQESSEGYYSYWFEKPEA